MMISLWLLSCWTASTRINSFVLTVIAARPVTVTMLSRLGFVNQVHYTHRQVNSIESVRATTSAEAVIAGSRLNSTAHHNDSSAAAKVNVIGGHVYFVATPIGNLDDITLRAINVLTNADVVCVEDSRHSVHLLRHLGIQHKTMVSHHEHNLQSSIPRILDLARSGKSIAVVSDAGTPGISDPGAQLAEALGRAKIPIHPIPGPSALVAALSVAGFAASPCTFLGFLPVKGAARSELLELMATTTHTMVFYESPHRIRKTIQDLLHHRRDAEGRAGEVVPGLRSRSIVVCRELTKLYEELIRGSLVEVAEALSIPTEESETEQLPETSLLSLSLKGIPGGKGIQERGEFTVVIGPAVPCPDHAASTDLTGTAAAKKTLMALREDGVRRSEAVRLCVDMLRMPKSSVYALALDMQW